MIKKFFLIILIFVSSCSLISCADKNVINIGILQYIEHNALTKAKEGFIDGLKEEGFIDGENIKIKVFNPESDATTMALQSKELARTSDLILAIATPAAVSVVNAVKEEGKETPVLFTAVTDPIASNLIESFDNPGGFVTGTTDMNPIAEQIGLIKELKLNAKRLGIIYTASETNSEVQSSIAKSEAEKLGLEVEIKTIESVNDLQMVTNQLVNNVDVLYIPTDNIISAAMGIVKGIIEEKKIVTIVGESNMVYAGGSITYGVDYYRLGKQTAKMAVEILKNKKSPKDIKTTSLEEYSLVINLKQLEAMQIKVPDEVIKKADEVIK